MTHPLSRARFVAYIEADNMSGLHNDLNTFPISEGEAERVRARIEEIIGGLTVNGIKVRRVAVRSLEVKLGNPTEAPAVSNPEG